jgi:small subunit ribosomal protein S8e
MVMWHLRSKRKPTSGRLRRLRKKRKMDRGSEFLEIRIGSEKKKQVRARGDLRKTRLLSSDKANVANPRTRKIQVSKILSVEENPANPHYVRRNIITKGAVIKTELGLARVTSRPGQSGIINAVLLEEKGK